jgi:hypothetical protein
LNFDLGRWIRMAPVRKLNVIGSITILLGLSLGAVGYCAWSLMLMHTRPWHLEANVQSRMVQCGTGPGVSYFGEEWNELAVRVENARLCIEKADKKYWFLPDYSQCISLLLSAGLDAQLLSLKINYRQRDQKKKLEALLATLSCALAGSEFDQKIWMRFGLRNYNEGRARSLLDQAEFFNDRGEVESALTSILRAWDAYTRFSYQSDAKFARFDDPVLLVRWKKDADQLLKWTRRSGHRAILVDKLSHQCFLVNKGKIQKRYSANLGRNWHRRKDQAGDAATPEGAYKVKRLIPRGKYGYALMLDYPNAEDKRRFQTLKRNGTMPWAARIGGNIEIHGRGIPRSIGPMATFRLMTVKCRNFMVLLIWECPLSPGRAL